MGLTHRFRYNPPRAELLPEVQVLWERRREFLPRYRTDSARRFGIRESTLIIANHLEQATVGGVTEWAGPGLLPERVTRDIEAAHRRLLPERRRALTWADADPAERGAALTWATEVIQDPTRAAALAPWCPDLVPPDNPQPLDVAAAKVGVAERFWPETVTLVAGALVHLHDELVAPLRPALPSLAEVLASRGKPVPPDEVIGLLCHWRQARFTHAAFTFAAVRRELRDARARHGRHPLGIP